MMGKECTRETTALGKVYHAGLWEWNDKAMEGNRQIAIRENKGGNRYICILFSHQIQQCCLQYYCDYGLRLQSAAIPPVSHLLWDHFFCEKYLIYASCWSQFSLSKLSGTCCSCFLSILFWSSDLPILSQQFLKSLTPLTEVRLLTNRLINKKFTSEKPVFHSI